MIATDTSALSSYLRGEKGPEVDRVDAVLSAGELVLPPVVVSEMLSSEVNIAALEALIQELDLLEIIEGYWHRAGHARRMLHSKGLKAKVGDALIAQSCIDHDVALITRDRDFRNFARHCGLKLA